MTGPVAQLSITNRPRYLFCDAFLGTIIEEMPLTGVTFENGMNVAGQLSGTLDLEDPFLQEMDYLGATIVNRCCLYVDIGGVLAWGGVITGTDYDVARPGALKITAQEHYWYFTQRLQAQDYSTQWASSTASASAIGFQVMADALNSEIVTWAVPPISNPMLDGILPVTIAEEGEASADNQIYFTAPYSQRLSVAMIVGELSSMGYGVGYDFASDPSYTDGIPTPQITISYPTRGKALPEPLVTMDVGDALGFTYQVDGTQQANGMVEMLTGSGGISGEGIAGLPMEDGWPLLEAVGSHTSMSSVSEPDSIIEAFLLGDLVQRAYPLVTATITYPLFNDASLPDGGGNYPTFGDWSVGDQVLLTLQANAALPANPRFPDGLNYYFRIVKAQIKIADQGVSTVTFTLNVPPADSADSIQQPPGLD